SLVATGKKVKEWEENGLRHSSWESDREFPVAGFNLGDFTILSDTSGPVPISVSVNNDVEIIYREIAERRAFQKQVALNAAIAGTGRRGQPPLPPQTVQPDVDVFSTKGLAENVLKGIADTVSFFVDRFGPYPY